MPRTQPDRRRRRGLPLRVVSAAVTIAALPVASLVLGALLRSPSVGRRLVAVPTGERWDVRVTPTFGGVGFAAVLAAGAALAVAVGAVDASWELVGILAGRDGDQAPADGRRAKQGPEDEGRDGQRGDRDGCAHDP